MGASETMDWWRRAEVRYHSLNHLSPNDQSQLHLKVSGNQNMKSTRLSLPKWLSFLALVIAFVSLRLSLGQYTIPTFTGHP